MENGERTVGMVLLGAMLLVFGIIGAAVFHAGLTATNSKAALLDYAALDQARESGAAVVYQTPDGVPRWQAHARPFTARADQPIIAVIGIDPGERSTALDELLNTNRNVTLALAHDFNRTRWRLNTVREHGNEVLTLLPTAYDETDFSRYSNVLRRGLSEEELRRRTLWSLSIMDGTVGALEYGGGDILRDTEALDTVFTAVADAQALYVEGSGASDSLALPVARGKGVPVSRVTSTIPKGAEEEVILSRIKDAENHARRWGYAVLMVEPERALLEEVTDWVRKPSRGIIIAPISAVVGRMRASTS